MGAGWSVTLVSNDGEEVPVPVDGLSSASAIWRDRLQLVGSLDPSQRSEENCTGEEIKAFVQVISARSNDAKTPATQIPLQTLLHSLPLVHKYDCKGTKLMLDELDAVHFPDDGVVTRHGLVQCHDPQHCINSNNWLVARGDPFEFTAPWLTQAHLDYVTLKQELYGPESVLTGRMQKLLAKLLTEPPAYGGRYISVVDDQGIARVTSITPSGSLADMPLIHVEKQDSATEFGKNATSSNTPGLVLQAWRLDAHTLLSLIPLLRTTF